MITIIQILLIATAMPAALVASVMFEAGRQCSVFEDDSGSICKHNHLIIFLTSLLSIIAAALWVRCYWKSSMSEAESTADEAHKGATVRTSEKESDGSSANNMSIGPEERRHDQVDYPDLETIQEEQRNRIVHDMGYLIAPRVEDDEFKHIMEELEALCERIQDSLPDTATDASIASRLLNEALKLRLVKLEWFMMGWGSVV